MQLFSPVIRIAPRHGVLKSGMTKSAYLNNSGTQSLASKKKKYCVVYRCCVSVSVIDTIGTSNKTLFKLLCVAKLF